MIKHMTMTNYDGRYDNGVDDGNKDVYDDENEDSRSGSDCPIFDPIRTPQSCSGESVNDGNSTAYVAHYIFTLLKM